MNVKSKKRLDDIQPYQPGKPIEEVKRELGLRNVIKLASNESPYGPSPKVLKAISEAARQINRYPESGSFYLREALARRLKVDPKRLIFGNGSDEIIILAVRAFVEEGDEVVIARPSFLIYDIASRIAGANIKSVPLKGFSYDLEGMKKAISATTKIVFIGNPDNPAGTYVNERQLSAFLRKIPKNVLIFIDEAYFEYVNEKDYPDSIGLQSSYKNLITTRTFSKFYGLAGLRIGYGIACPEIIAVLEKIREPFNINSIAQKAALTCLQDRAYYSNIALTLQKEKKFLVNEMKKMGLTPGVTVTNFILVDVKKNSGEIVQGLMKKGVIVRDMRFWGLDRFIRVTVGTPTENRTFLKAFKQVMA